MTLKWLPNTHMLADVLTKRKVEPNDLLHIVQTSESLDKLGY